MTLSLPESVKAISLIKRLRVCKASYPFQTPFCGQVLLPWKDRRDGMLVMMCQCLDSLRVYLRLSCLSLVEGLLEGSNRCWGGT
jgi:hypothetical protein